MCVYVYKHLKICISPLTISIIFEKYWLSLVRVGELCDGGGIRYVEWETKYVWGNSGWWRLWFSQFCCTGGRFLER